MKRLLALSFVLGALCLGAHSVAGAAPITYEGSIANYGVVTGSVGGYGIVDDDAANVDFWRVTGNAGSLLTLVGTRLNAPLDLSLRLYFGVTTADQSLFTSEGSFDSITLVGFADDELAPPNHLGPFGDPMLQMILPFTGTYTIAIGGFASDGDGPYGYRLFAAVPAPSTVPLLVAGLLTLGFVLRRSRTTQR